LAAAGRGLVDRPSSGGSDSTTKQIPSKAATLADWKELIGNIYRDKAPEKLEGLDALLNIYKGEEEGLYFRICEYYGCQPAVAKARALEPAKSTFIEVPKSKFDSSTSNFSALVSPELKCLEERNGPRRSNNTGKSTSDESSQRFPMRGEDWFSELFGFTEEARRGSGPAAYKATQERLIAIPQSGSKWMLSGSNGQQYQAGHFWTPSLSELRTTVGRMGKLDGKLSVRNIVGDVSMMHADESNRHATFQVASQFNCLEFVSENITPEDGITGYVWDKTQGPACAIACGPATAFRNYLADVRGGKGQQSNRQINNLHLVLSRLGNNKSNFLQVKNGYTMADCNGLTALGQVLENMSVKAYESLLGDLCVGVHEDVQVTSCDWARSQLRDKRQTVTQVLASACSVSYSKPCSDRSKWAPFARFVLAASYEATLWAALGTALRHHGKGGSNRVYLTSLGGGVFGNEKQWIIDAMASAFDKFQNTGLEVYIVSYGRVESGYDELASRFNGS